MSPEVCLDLSVHTRSGHNSATVIMITSGPVCDPNMGLQTGPFGIILFKLLWNLGFSPAPLFLSRVQIGVFNL